MKKILLINFISVKNGVTIKMKLNSASHINYIHFLVVVLCTKIVKQHSMGQRFFHSSDNCCVTPRSAKCGENLLTSHCS